MLAIVTVMAIIPIMSLTAFAEPSTPEAEQYFITMYWGMSYTEELGYIVDKAPMVYDEARGLYTYTVKNAVLKGDGGISIDAYDSDNNKIGIGLFGHIHSDAYGVSVYATLQPGNGSNSLALDRIDPVAPPEWRNGHVAVIDSNDDDGVGKSDQYIQLNPENGVHTATVENMDACEDRRIYLLIDGIVVDIQYITIPTDGSTVIFTSDGNIVSYTVETPTHTYVAEVNGTPYESITDAISAAKAAEGSTLKLLADINDEITINGGKFTLDLNGYNIIGNFFALKILGGDITITDSIGDGEINGTHKDGNGVVVENGTCAIEKVTVIGTWVGISGKSSNITVNSGTVTGGYYGIYASTCDLSINGGDILGYSLGMMMYGSSCIVEDGTVKGGIAAMYVAGHYGYADSSKTGSTCIIEGGVITGGNYCICVEDINYRDDNGNIVLVEGGACTITGGSFNADPSEYVAEGYAATLNSETNMYSVAVYTAPSYVAEVNGTSYDSIANAISAAKVAEGSTLKLLADVNNGIEIDGGKFTIDLNGYSITNNNRLNGLAINGGNIIVIDSSAGKTGTIIGSEKGVYIVNGTVTVNSGTISGDVDGIWGEDSNIIINSGTISGDGCAISGKDSNITINGGSISSDYRSIYLANSSITVNGGDILGESFGIILFGSNCTIEDGMIGGGAVGVHVTGYYNGENNLGSSSTCIIEGGMITGGTYCVLVQDYKYRDADGNAVVVDGGTCTIKGGSFNTDPFEYVAEGYAATLNSKTNMYNVAVYTAPSYIAEVNGTPYESITDAISAAEAIEGSTLKLLADVSGEIAVDGGKFTFDLNGFGINSTANTLTVINGDIIITDSSSERTGTIFGKSCGVIVYGGSCTISGGTVSGTLYGVYIQDATCEITGGIITGGTDGVNIVSGTCKITGGTISSENYGVFIRNGSCIITGGIINGDYTGVYIYGGSLSVSGGSFNTAPSAEYVAEGYVATYNVTTELYDVVACTPPAITGVTFNSDSEGYDSENNVFYITDETPLIITVTGTNMEIFNEFYHLAFLYNGNGPMVKASAVTATEAKLIVDSSVLDYIIEGLELLGSTTDTTGFGIRSLKKTELTYYTELSIKKGAPPAPDYTVELPSDTENGAVTSDVSSAKAGDTVTLTFTPAEGYGLESVTVTDKDGKAVELENNSFVMPEGGVKISATFSPVPEVTVPGTDDGSTVTDPHGTDNSITTDNGSDAQSSDNTLVIVIAVVIALVAIGGGIAALVVISGKNKKKIKK